MIGQAKLLIGGALLIGAFFAGWQVNGWRLSVRYQEEELARQAAFNSLLEARTAEVDRINAESQARQAELLAARVADQEFIAGLQNEIATRPIIRQDVRVPVQVGDRLECPAVPAVDWGVFREIYNRAATGTAGSGPTGGSDAAVPVLTSNDHAGSGVPLGH